MTSRRGFLIGLGAALAAPAVVRAESLMKIAALRGPPHPLLLEAQINLIQNDIYREMAAYVYNQRMWMMSHQAVKVHFSAPFQWSPVELAS